MVVNTKQNNMSSSSAQMALEAFMRHPDLERLEQLLQRPRMFNLFEMLDIVRQELRHSDILAFLLDPEEMHGLGATFTRALLSRALGAGGQNAVVHEINLAECVFEPVLVLREWEFIDVLLLSPADQLIVIIENKIDTSEHSNQLTRYYDLVTRRYPSLVVLGLYLTPEGDLPAHPLDQERYIAIGYDVVLGAIDDTLSQSLIHVQADVAVVLRHYHAVLRRHIVTDSNIDLAQMARRLYVDHQEAIDLMIAQRDRRQRMIMQYIDTLLNEAGHAHPGLLRRDDPGTHPRTHVWFTRFAPAEWYVPELQISTRWTKSRQILLFQFMYSPADIKFDLAVGPGPTAGSLRQTLFDLAEQHPTTLGPTWNDPTGDWFSIYGRLIFGRETDYFATCTDNAIKQVIRTYWDSFLKDDLPRIMNVIRHAVLGQEPA